MIKHLREQQARLEVEAETASVLRIKQTRLEETIKSLQADLKEAKKSHSPVCSFFDFLFNFLPDHPDLIVLSSFPALFSILTIKICHLTIMYHQSLLSKLSKTL